MISPAYSEWFRRLWQIVTVILDGALVVAACVAILIAAFLTGVGIYSVISVLLAFLPSVLRYVQLLIF